MQDISQDMNTLFIQTDGRLEESGPAPTLANYGVTSSDGTVRVVFKHLAEELTLMIRQAPLVVGCVAWLTHEGILAELSHKSGVSIVVQKEDFLRPDLARHSGWATHLRRLYDALPCGVGRLDAGVDDTVLYQMSCCCDPAVEPVRCVGNHNAAKVPAFPRMHHKFLVFCRYTQPFDDTMYEPYAVWTGSFNLTKNAAMSLENSIVLTDPVIVQAYFKEWSQVLALSEPLDWETPWIEPQWRIGT